jgi:hypothetical protein
MLLLMMMLRSAFLQMSIRLVLCRRSVVAVCGVHTIPPSRSAFCLPVNPLLFWLLLLLLLLLL